MGAILLTLGLIYRFWPYLEDIRGGDRGDIALKEAQVRKYRKIVRNADTLERKALFLEKTLERLESGLLTGRTPSLAAADIQNILSGFAGRNGVEISSVRVLDPKKVENQPYVGIPVQFTVEPTMRQLKEILYRIASSEKYLTVEELRITVARRRHGEQIQAVITVSGYMKRTGK